MSLTVMRLKKIKFDMTLYIFAQNKIRFIQTLAREKCKFICWPLTSKRLRKVKYVLLHSAQYTLN